MALTQISTAGVKDDAVTAGKIPANAVGSSELADNAVDTDAIQNGAVTNDKIASGIAASKITGLSTDAITEGNSKAEVIGSGTNDGEFKVTLQDATSNGAGAVSLHQYTSGSYNITELNPSSGGNVSANSSLIFNHLTANNSWSNIIFNQSGASTGQSQIRCSAGTAFTFYPQDGNVMLTLNNTASTFANLVQPAGDSTYDLGTNTNRWRNVYADTLYGDGSNLTGVSSVGGSTGADFNDDTKLRFGGSNQLEVFYGSSKGQIAVTSGQLELLSSGNITGKVNNTETAFHAAANAQLELYHNGTKQCETSTNGLAFPSGKGIDFSATANGTGSGSTSELFDDYEEGTWTGAIETGSANINNEWYIKSGGYVVGGASITAIGNLSSSNAIRVTGLPFSSSGGGSAPGAIAGSKISVLDRACMSTVSGSSIYFLASSTSTGSWDYIKHQHVLQSSGSLTFAFHYYTLS